MLLEIHQGSIDLEDHAAGVTDMRREGGSYGLRLDRHEEGGRYGLRCDGHEEGGRYGLRCDGHEERGRYDAKN